MKRDVLGENCKRMEFAETLRRAEIGQPIYVRIDGSRFSKFTRGMNRPFDARMAISMIGATKAIMSDYHALIGYTQSDEISLVFYDPVNETHHGGKYQKIVSRLASKATARFTKIASENGLGDFIARQHPEFDARAFAVPTLVEAATVLLWRQLDAVKNAVQMAARAVCSAKQLDGKNTDEQLRMIADKGVFFDGYPAFFRQGTFVRRVTEQRMLTPEEMARIPEQHRPVGPVLRHRFDDFHLPPPGTPGDLAALLFGADHLP